MRNRSRKVQGSALTPNQKKLTIHQIAELAGVSTGTVSRALNNNGRIAAQTRKRILEIIKQTGFTPDQAAQQLARGTTRLIGVASTEGALRRPYYSFLLDAIQESLIPRGYAVRVLEAHEDLATNGCAGFIVPGLHVNDSRPNFLRSKHIPTVVIGQPREGCGCVNVNPRTGILEAVQHLNMLGHTRIVHLTGPPSGEESLARLAAYRAGLDATNIAFDAELIADGNFSDLDAYRAVQRMIKRGQQFTAVLAASDEMALGAIRAFEDNGQRVPHDASVIGYDDLPFAKHANPSLSTVRQPIRNIGHAAAEILLAHFDDQPLRTIEINTHLVVRSSSAPCSSAKIN